MPWFVIGRHPRTNEPIEVASRGSLIVVGEPGTGKSTGLIQVNAFPWHLGPTLVRSTRPDNRHRVLRANVAAGRRCFVLDLDATGVLPAGCEPLRVSLLERATTWSAARETALRLMRATREPGVSLSGTDAVFEDFGAELLGALLFAAALGRGAGFDLTLVDVSEWLADLRSGTSELAYCERLLVELGGLDGRHALGGLANVAFDRSNRGDTLQKVSEAAGHLLVGAPLAALADADRRGGTDLAAVVDQCGLVFIEVSDDNAARARSHSALSTLVEDDMVTAGRQRWRRGGVTEPLRLLYDETATGTVNPNVVAWAATGGGDGIAVMICAQSLTQLERVFPKEGAGLVEVFNHRLFLRGHALEGARIASMFGEHEVEVYDDGWDQPLFGRPSRHRGRRSELRPRVTPDDLVQMRDGFGLLVSRDVLGPVRLVPSFGEPWASRFPA